MNIMEEVRMMNQKLEETNIMLLSSSEYMKKKCAMFQPVAVKKNITITLNAEDDIVIRVDPRALDRICNNLSDNAVKYTQENGKEDIKEEGIPRDKPSILIVDDNIQMLNFLKTSLKKHIMYFSQLIHKLILPN